MTPGDRVRLAHPYRGLTLGAEGIVASFARRDADAVVTVRFQEREEEVPKDMLVFTPVQRRPWGRPRPRSDLPRPHAMTLSMSLIELDLGATRHHLTLTEARLLRNMLGEKRSAGAVVLERSIREAIDATSPQPIRRLSLDDIAALRSVLCGKDLGGFQGLGGLQTALCRETG